MKANICSRWIIPNGTKVMMTKKSHLKVQVFDNGLLKTREASKLKFNVHKN